MTKAGNILLKAFFVLSLFLYSATSLFAEERVDFKDKLIASTFKTLAKTFVSTVDLDNLKRDNIRRINKMNEAKFRKKFTEIYAIIKDLPISIKLEYGIREDMTKEQVVKEIGSLNKAAIYRLIDQIPDTFITSQFRNYLVRGKQEIQQNNLAAQISKVWDKMTSNAKEPGS